MLQVDPDPAKPAANESTPPSPAHLSDRHEDVMAVTLTNDDVRCQVCNNSPVKGWNLEGKKPNLKLANRATGLGQEENEVNYPFP